MSNIKRKAEHALLRTAFDDMCLLFKRPLLFRRRFRMLCYELKQLEKAVE